MNIVEKMHFDTCIWRMSLTQAVVKGDMCSNNITLAQACTSDILNVKLQIHGGMISNQNVVYCSSLYQ